MRCQIVPVRDCTGRLVVVAQTSWFNNLDMESVMHPYLSNEKFSFASQRPTPGFRDRSVTTLGVLRRWFQASLRRWQRRRMIAALEALDDRLLRDIGIYRGEIRRIVGSFDDRELRMTPVSTKVSQLGI